MNAFDLQIHVSSCRVSRFMNAIHPINGFVKINYKTTLTESPGINVLFVQNATIDKVFFLVRNF